MKNIDSIYDKCLMFLPYNKKFQNNKKNDIFIETLSNTQIIHKRYKSSQ